MTIPEFDLPNLPALPPLQERHIGSVFARALARHPDKLAVHDTREGLSYRELHDSALQLAGGLSRLNVARQEPVLMMLDNHIDFIRCWMATALTARVEVPINTAYVGVSLSHAINTSGAKVMIIEEPYVERVLAVRHELEELRTLVVRGASENIQAPRLSVMNFGELRRGAPDQPAEHKASDTMAILYTSGTSGPSKGSINSQAHAYTYAHPSMFGAAEESDVALIVLPLFHMGGQWAGVYNALVAGATAVIVPRFSASTFWETAARYEASYCFLLGSMVHFLLGQAPGPQDRRHGLRKMLLVPVPQELEHFRERFGIEKVAAAYGSTEAAVVSRAPVGYAEAGKAGWVRPEVQAMVVDAEGLPLAPGEVGELWVRPMEAWTMMNGYIGMPEATVSAWQNFWFHTGDAARFAEDGQVVFVDRIKDAIRRRGENISSYEVEQAIGQHPDVEECAVIAVPSEYVEDEVKACVVLRPGAQADPQMLIAFLSTRLPRFCLPRYIEFMLALPKTPTAKVKKIELRQQGVTPATWDSQRESPEELQARFARDGVVCLRGVLTGQWLDEARACFEWSLANPGPRSSNYGKGDAGTFYVDTGNPKAYAGYAELLARAPLKDRVRAAMGSRELWFAFEQVFFKEGGVEKAQRTAWHQDTSYLSFDGPHLAVAWTSFDPVPRESALEFIRGSHRGPLFEQRGVAQSERPTVPRIEEAREQFDILGWAVEPGDVLMFHPSILHGGGPTRAGTRRRTLSLRFFGDKATYLQREFGKDTPECFRELRLEDGQPFRGPAFRALP